jgi:prepilin-type N-terminal cleavage/methylation domain-containing protein
MNNRGITLIEMLVVIAVIGILVIALSFSFQGWMGKYRVESEIKTLHVDLMNARARAMTRNRFYFADFPSTTSYRLIEDTNENNASNPGAGDTILPTFPKTVEYALACNGTGILTTTFSFDKRGIVNLGRTICVFTDVDGNGTSDYDPDYDCIVISQTRINIGKLTTQDTAGGACDSTNCVVK